MNVCCDWLRVALENMNMNGLTVVPRHKFGQRCFVVRFSWVDPNLWKRLGSTLPPSTPFATAAEKVINFCPGCGTELDEIIARDRDAFDLLVSQVID
jgi:hypothetical protein